MVHRGRRQAIKSCHIQSSRVVPFLRNEPNGHFTRFRRKAASGGAGVEPNRQREGAVCFYMLSCRQPGQTDRDCAR
jgi:hypothetical protein